MKEKMTRWTPFERVSSLGSNLTKEAPNIVGTGKFGFLGLIWACRWWCSNELPLWSCFLSPFSPDLVPLLGLEPRSERSLSLGRGKWGYVMCSAQ